MYVFLMIETIAYTLKKQNYTEMLSALKALPLSEEMRATFLTVISDHRGVTRAAEAAIKKQLRKASGIFSALGLCEPLFKSTSSGEAEPGSSSQPDNQPPENVSDEELKKKARNKRPNPPIKIAHPLPPEALKCPSCSKNMHRAHKKVVTIIRVEGFKEERNEIETARCLCCGVSVEAECSQSKEKTILQFSLPAAALIIGLRYAFGMPSFRLEAVTSSMGYRVPDSTQWDLFETAGNELHGFVKFLRETAKTAPVVQMDDTSVRINELTQMFKLRANGDVEALKSDRTGVNTTGFVAKFALGKICLFESGLHHAGEYFEKLMATKTIEDEVILMADASSSNTSKIKLLALEVRQANCNSHASRKFKELKDNPIFEEHVAIIMELYKSVFELDKKLKLLEPDERLRKHQEFSLPKMEHIKAKILADFENHVVEPNSELGRAYNYFLNHFHKLTAFCKFAGAPICNNEVERVLKRAIRHRKNSLFYKNLIGAAIGDIHMTILLTAKENGIEPIEYLTHLLEFKEERQKNPDSWLPWNYPATIATLKPPPPNSNATKN